MTRLEEGEVWELKNVDYEDHGADHEDHEVFKISETGSATANERKMSRKEGATIPIREVDSYFIVEFVVSPISIVMDSLLLLVSLVLLHRNLLQFQIRGSKKINHARYFAKVQISERRTMKNKRQGQKAFAGLCAIISQRPINT